MTLISVHMFTNTHNDYGRNWVHALYFLAASPLGVFYGCPGPFFDAGVA